MVFGEIMRGFLAYFEILAKSNGSFLVLLGFHRNVKHIVDDLVAVLGGINAHRNQLTAQTTKHIGWGERQIGKFLGVDLTGLGNQADVGITDAGRKESVKPEQERRVNFPLGTIDIVELVVGGNKFLPGELGRKIHAANQSPFFGLGRDAVNQQHIMVFMRQRGDNGHQKPPFDFLRELNSALSHRRGINQGDRSGDRLIVEMFFIARGESKPRFHS